MSVQLHPVLQGSPVENATLYEVKLHVHELLKRVDRMEKAVNGLMEVEKGKWDRAFKANLGSKP